MIIIGKFVCKIVKIVYGNGSGAMELSIKMNLFFFLLAETGFIVRSGNNLFGAVGQYSP